MPAPISLDLRRRIVWAVEGGSSIRAAAQRFAVSPSTAIKLMQRVRATGSPAPAGRGDARNHVGRAAERAGAALRAADRALDDPQRAPPDRPAA
jgi:transposase